MKICRRLRIGSFLFPECLSNRAGRPLYSIDLLANVPIVFVAHRLIAEPSPSIASTAKFQVDFLCASRYLSKAKLNVRVLCIYEVLERFSEVPCLVSQNSLNLSRSSGLVFAGQSPVMSPIFAKTVRIS